MRINGPRNAVIRGRSASIVLCVSLCVPLAPSVVASQDEAVDEAHALVDRALTFARAHPRARGRFEHTYFDRARTSVLHDRGTFVVALPRARIELDGDMPRSIAIDETTARVLVPDAPTPLALSFRIDTTPLPTLLALLRGDEGSLDAFSVRRVPADGAAVLELRPNDPLAQLDRVWLELADDGAITRVLVVDLVGGTHRIVLDAVRYPSSVPDAALALDVPAGTVTVEP